MKTASAYKALWDGDKQFLSAIAKEVAMLAAVSNNMNHFQKQLTEFSDKWKAYKTAHEADRKKKWQPSMGKPKNPMGTIWPLNYGSGWRDGVEKCFPEKGGHSIRLSPCRDIKGVLGAYALLAVIHDNVSSQCPHIAKDVFPKELSQEIWRNLVTGIDLEGQTFSGGGEVSQQPRSVIRRGKIASFLIDVRADIGQDATPLSEIEKLYFNKFSPTHRKLWEAEKEKQKQPVKNVQANLAKKKQPELANDKAGDNENDIAIRPAEPELKEKLSDIVPELAVYDNVKKQLSYALLFPKAECIARYSEEKKLSKNTKLKIRRLFLEEFFSAVISMLDFLLGVPDLSRDEQNHWHHKFTEYYDKIKDLLFESLDNNVPNLDKFNELEKEGIKINQGLDFDADTYLTQGIVDKTTGFVKYPKPAKIRLKTSGGKTGGTKPTDKNKKPRKPLAKTIRQVLGLNPALKADPVKTLSQVNMMLNDGHGETTMDVFKNSPGWKNRHKNQAK